MGASEFFHTGKGKTAAEAFKAARAEAQYDHGHSGYTGSLAEKTDFTVIQVPEGKKPREYASELMNAGDGRINDKWGPAGCVKISEGQWLFFGWASS